MIGMQPSSISRSQRLAGVQVLAAIDEVVRHQQHLRGDQTVRASERVVRPHQPALPSRGDRLQGRHVGRPRRQPERGDAGRHRAGRHEDHLVAVGAQRRPADRTACRRPCLVDHTGSSVIDDVPILATEPHSGLLLVLEAEVADPDDVALLRAGARQDPRHAEPLHLIVDVRQAPRAWSRR